MRHLGHVDSSLSARGRAGRTTPRGRRGCGTEIYDAGADRARVAAGGGLHRADGAALGKVFIAPLDVVLEKRTALQPDVLFVSNERRESLERGRVIHGAPDLCVEVLSPATARLDRVRKLDLYARFGVTHVCIVDPGARRIEEYALAGDVYRVASANDFDAPFRPGLFPGFALDPSAFPAAAGWRLQRTGRSAGDPFLELQ